MYVECWLQSRAASERRASATCDTTRRGHVVSRDTRVAHGGAAHFVVVPEGFVYLGSYRKGSFAYDCSVIY